MTKESKGKMIVETAYGSFDVILDPTVPKDTLYMTNTSNWYRNDSYQATLKCKNRFVTAWRALFKGEVKLEWVVSSEIKDKRLHITGKLNDWRGYDQTE